MGEGRRGVSGRHGRAVEISQVLVNVCVNEDKVIISGYHVHQLRRQLHQENGIYLCAEFLQASFVFRQPLLTQTPPQSVDCAVGNAVVGAIQVAIANYKGTRHHPPVTIKRSKRAN